MRQDSRHKLFGRRFVFGVLFGLSALTVAGVFYTRVYIPTRAYAVAPSTLNFQARLLKGSGGIVADGNYSVQFKLYDAASAGTNEWTETQGTVAVKAGYLSVNLGSSTPFGAIDWGKEQWLTMNVNGDGEMNPRLKLTAVPYAFRAAQADTLTITGGTIAGDNLAQLAPTGLQSVNSTVAGLRINQTGSGGLLQLAAGGTDKFTISNAGNATLTGTLGVSGASVSVGTTSQAGSLVLSDGSSNTVSLTASGVGTSYGLTLPTAAPLTDQCLRADTVVATQLVFANCGSRKVQQSYNSYSINQAATATTAQNFLLPTTATAFSAALAGTNEVKMTRAGSFRSCSIFNSAAVTAGSVSVHFRKNGADVSATNYCTLNTTNTRSNTQDIDPGIETFAAGDTIGVALVSTGLAPITSEHWVNFTVEFGTGSDSGIFKLQDGYNNSTATELTLDSTRGGLTVRDASAAIGGNLFEIQNNTGATTYFGVTTTGTTSANALTISSGGLNNSSGGITNAGSITGVGTNITATAGLTLASGGAGDLTLDSASNKLVIGATDTTLQRTAAGMYTVDLNDTANTTLALVNSGTGLAGMTIDGSLSVGAGGAFAVNSSGDVTSTFAVLNGASTANGAGTASTTLVLASATNFDVGNYVQVVSTNCGGVGVNTCYAKITAKVTNTLTIAPALTWANAAAVTEYHIPEIGGTDTAQTLANRFGRGYFISGVATGNGTTYYNEDSITSSLSSFHLLDTGVTDLSIGGAATTITLGTSGTAVNVAGGLTVAGTSVVGTGGALTNISSVTGSAALSITSGAGGDLTFDSASNKIVIASNDTTLQRTSAGNYTIDLADGADTTLILDNSGTGSQNLNLNDGALQIAGTTVLTNGRVLQNVTANASIITAGLVGTARGGTGVDGSAAANGQLLIGNGSGYSLGSLSNNGGLTITPGAGTLGLAVNYGSAANTAVQGNTALTVTAGTGLTGGSTITLGSGGSTTLNVAYGSTANTAAQGNVTVVCPSGSGNLSGGGTSITIGTGGTCGALSTVANPSFATSVTSPIFTGSGAVSVSSGGTSDLTLDSASGVLVFAANDTTLRHVAAGTTNLELNDTANTTLQLNNTGTGAVNLNLNDGGLQIAGTTVITNGRVLQNVTFDGGSIGTGLVGTARGGTGLDGSAAANGQLLIGNGTGYSLGSLSNSGGLTITPGAGTLGLAVNYGSAANTAAQGNVTIICPSGSGNLSGGGTSITIGTGGTCGALSTVANPSFATSVSSPSFTSSGATQLSSTGANALTLTSGNGTISLAATSLSATAGLSLSSGGAGDLTLDSASNKLVIAATDTGLQRTAAGTYTIDLNDTAATTLVLNNSGTGAASLNLSDGGLQIGGTSILNNSRAFSNLTGISSSGTVQLSTLSAGGLIKSDTSGNLSVATAGTDYELPLTITSGLTRTTNTVRLGGNLGQATDIGLNGNALTITGSGGSLFTAFAAGGIDIKNDGATALEVRNTAGTVSYFTVNAGGNIVQVGSSTTDAVAVLHVLDSYNGASDPTGANGAAYYSSASAKSRCYEDGYWTDCVTDGILGETTLAVANATINVTLAKSYESLECRLESKGRSLASGVLLRFNNVSAANNYTWNTYSIQTVTPTDAQSTGDTEIQLNSTITSTAPFNADVKISNFADTRKGVDWTAASIEAAGTNPQRYSGAGMFTLTGSQITSVQFISSAGTFNAASHAWCMGRNVR